MSTAAPRTSLRDAMSPDRHTGCPRCGAPNECAPARSGSLETPCWCTAVVVNPAVLAALPDEQVGRACLCRSCATMPATHDR